MYWMNENWRDELLPPKTKRLYADATKAMNALESDPEKFDLYCILYLLHGSRDKQWAYATNRSDVICLMVQMLHVFLKRMKHNGSIEFNFSYPRHAVQDQLRGVDDLSNGELVTLEREWVIHRWQELLPIQVPECHSFNPRTYANQKSLSASDPPGTIEIRIRKSLGILMSFRRKGEQLLSELGNH